MIRIKSLVLQINKTTLYESSSVTRCGTLPNTRSPGKLFFCVENKGRQVTRWCHVSYTFVISGFYYTAFQLFFCALATAGLPVSNFILQPSHIFVVSLIDAPAIILCLYLFAKNGAKVSPLAHLGSPSIGNRMRYVR